MTIQERIADVLGEHRYTDYYGTCMCKYHPSEGFANATPMTRGEHDEHQAEVLVAELGLTQLLRRDQLLECWPTLWEMVVQ